MPFVIDASVTLGWFFPDENAEYAAQVALRLKTDPAIAPDIWPYEVANALRTAQRRSRIEPSEVVRIADEASRLPVAIHQNSAAQILGPILNLACQQELTAYDASYLDLAMREALPIATLDDDLREAAARVGVRIVS